MSYKSIILFLALLFFGCSDKPSDDFIDNGIASFLAKTTTPSWERVENVHRMNEWLDENLKGIYYVEFSYRRTQTFDEPYASVRVDSIVCRLTFIREGDRWTTTPSQMQIVSFTNLSLK